jgi:uncharacterized protein YbjT (DUF2867 family)
VALVFGSGGLTGSILTQKLLRDPSFSKVKIFVRKKSAIVHSKAEEIIVDFENRDGLEKNLVGDVLFCCLGTTIRTAGSREAFEKVDLHYPVLLAEIAKRNGIGKYLLMSSLGADKSSGNFYLATKGLCEERVAATGIPSCYFFRPSMLLGKRKEFRMGELIGKFFMVTFSFAFLGKLKRYKAVKAENVAAAMLYFAVEGNEKRKVVENEEILHLAGVKPSL